METAEKNKRMRFEKGSLRPSERGIVQEFPVRLRVNGRDLATLVASPHQLNFLVAGFLRNQGFIRTTDDLKSLGVCADFGLAEVRIRGEVPERLAPTLTSGCGTGISFNLETSPAGSPCDLPGTFSPASIFSLMRELARCAENYASHGGIHSAAVGDGERLLLFAEDIGRHNTLDRIAGEALLRGLDLQGRMLVTSGRVSTEMVAKAARLGIVLIASRTSPTDMAVRMAEEAGICLLGYVRGETFDVYAGAERILLPDQQQKIAGVTGVILAGGESRRMGCDKSLLPLNGARFIDHIYRTLSALFDEVLIVTNSPALYQDIPCRKVPDIYFAKGSLAGIHSGLCHARNERIFVVACDMPSLSPAIIRQLCLRGEGADVAIPHSAHGTEPLHALYRKSCILPMETALDAGRRRIVSFFPEVQVRQIPAAELSSGQEEGKAFLNVNTPQEYFGLREGEKAGRANSQDDPVRLRHPG